ncbi:MAG: PH domain-containing protein [Candidatus Hydrogenedentota bacterium]
MVAASAQPFDPRAITRPDPALLRYYLIVSAFSLFLFPVVFVPLYLRYRSLRYDFQDEGIAMRWGVFFQREVHLTYRRIQDIHVTRGIVQRWMGLATIGIQTAAGNATPQMNVEGILDAEALRDFLYTKMRGAHDYTAPGVEGTSEAVSPEPAGKDETLALLHEIRDALRQLLAKKT